MKTTRNKQVMAIGQELLEGPRAIFPPASIDDFGWLGMEFRLLYRERGIWEAIAIYSDDTVNRESQFLAPLIRYIHWNYHPDITTTSHWPSIRRHLSHFDQHEQQVHARLQVLQETLSRIPFAAVGLQRERNIPTLTYDDRQGFLRVLLTNGAQSLEFETPTIQSEPDISGLCLDLLTYFKSIIAPFDDHLWRERYNMNIRKLLPLKFWDWDGQTPPNNSR